MENEETKPKKAKAKQDAPVSIRLSKEERFAFKQICETKGIPVSTMIRECCLAYLQNSREHAKLMATLMPQDPKEAQKTFSDLINNNTETIVKILEQLRLDVLNHNEQMDDLLRRVIYLEFYFGQIVDEKDKENKAKLARNMVNKFFKTNLKDELNREQG